MKNTFKYNKKRKHYSYIFKIKKGYCINILLTTKFESKQKKHGKEMIVRNIKLFKHPNNKSTTVVYIYNHSPYFDSFSSFDRKTLNWFWNKNDKRKVKRFKKYKKNKKYFEGI